MMLALFETWDGPPLSLLHRWMWILVLAVGAVCSLLLIMLAARGRLSIGTHIMIAMFPLFLSLVLAVGYAWDVWLDYYGPRAWVGPPPEHLIVPAMFCTLVGFPCSVALVLLLGMILLVRSRREQPREKA
jgi:hypothetical protein